MKPEKIPTLHDVCELIVDCLHQTAPTQEEGYPLIRTPNIKRGRLDLSGVFRVSEEIYNIWNQRTIPQTNDLIIAREAPAGNVAIIKEGQIVCLGQRTVLIRPNIDLVDPDFLCYFLLAPKQQGKLLAGETGATVTHVNMKDIRKLPLENLPDLPIQKKTGQILASYDDLIESNRRRIELLEESARLLYREWFVYLRFPGHEHTPIIDGIPEGWEKPTLGEVGYLNYGKSLKKDARTPGKYPVFGSGGIIGTHHQFLVEAPGIIVGRKGSIGTVFWSSENYYPIDTTYFINSESSNLYLYYALLNQKFMSTDAAVPGLNRDFAHSAKILIPNRKYFNLFNDFVQPMYNQISQLTKYNNKLQEARDILLPRLMNGEIAV
jgi:type I restriction enzyme S subunit